VEKWLSFLAALTFWLFVRGLIVSNSIRHGLL